MEVDRNGADMGPPAVFDEAQMLPKRQPPRGLLPATWLSRPVKFTYVGGDGLGLESVGTLLDWCGTGVIVALDGQKTVIAWDRLVTLTLEDG